jgi:hypothetical protein
MQYSNCSGPVLAFHQSAVCGWIAERDPIPRFLTETALPAIYLLLFAWNILNVRLV